jgi:hypothetical protein
MKSDTLKKYSLAAGERNQVKNVEAMQIVSHHVMYKFVLEVRSLSSTRKGTQRRRVDYLGCTEY